MASETTEFVYTVNEDTKDTVKLETTTSDKKEDSESGKNQDVVKKPTGSAGFAQIKAEYLLRDHKPILQTEYLSEETKEKLEFKGQEVNSKGDDITNPDASAKRSSDDLEAPKSEQWEPPNKKQKLTGRNKQRPKFERAVEKDRLCPAIKEDRVCNFGKNCKFNHDIKDFMENKPPDLPGSCYNFDIFGFCKYGLSCRFAKNHTSDDLKNVKNTELFDKTRSLQPVNLIDQETRKLLWKKKYNFKDADKMVQTVHNMSGKEWEENKKPQAKPKESLPPTDIQTDGSETVKMADIQDNDKEKKPMSETVIADKALDAKPRTMGQITDEELFPLRGSEKVKIDFRNKTYLAPLTTVGNLPFRRVCKDLGVDVTCGEMALATQILQAKQSEWSLLKRHPCEDLFGVQICGGYPDTMTRCAQLLVEKCDIDFIDINCGCPIDMIYNKGSGSALMGKSIKLTQICSSMLGVMGSTPLTVKLRKGVHDKNNSAHLIIPKLRDVGVSMITVHGRSREQRYTRGADWDYISECVESGTDMPVFGNGDVLSYEDANIHMANHNVSGCMVARGALIKPWIFTEIKEQRHWDISANERLDLLKNYTNYGMEHWGSDHQGIETTRRFMLEWLSFLHRYIPVGVLEQVPQRINERPPYYIGRNDLETLMASANCADWVKITEMLLGPVPPSFKFLPKHKANAYA